MPIDPIAVGVKQRHNEGMNRKAKIEAMLAETPDDSFLRYSLAMELRSEGNQEQSLQVLGDLVRAEPPMVAAFFMAAQQHVEMGNIESARELLRSGIEEARRQHDQHAAAEMSELLMGLGELGEDL